MKHIFIIETVGTISARDAANLAADIQEVTDKSLGETANFVRHICNENSAIRAMYRLFGADEAQSPDQLGSAK